MFYFDIGIAQRILGLDIKQWLLNPLQVANQGTIAEQYENIDLRFATLSHTTYRNRIRGSTIT